MTSDTPELMLHGRPVDGPLQLLSRSENGLTFALGYTLQQSPRLLSLFCDRVGLSSAAARRHLIIALQQYHDEGITDIELLADNRLLAVVEAKVGGWPRREQLSRYAHRLKRAGTARSVLVPLGVPPFSRVLWTLGALHGIPVVPLRWVEVLALVTRVLGYRGGDERHALAQLSAFIQEVIGMQAYNREVLVRDLNCKHTSYPLFMEFDMYACQPQEIAEPLFFAPCFTNASTSLGNGIHYVSRVYFRTVASLRDADDVERALADAVQVIRDKVDTLKKKKRADEQVRYLESLPAKWRRGCRYQRKNRRRDTTALFFLGDPIRLPVPMRKRGKMIPIGFSMTMEQLMSAEPAVFNC